ncbi:MAG: hypothetical protein CTY15_06080 [Methylocystis sp.]|nr:MAG: hypothetical protein CTY15_06080 [Methylocystis sp.]
MQEGEAMSLAIYSTPSPRAGRFKLALALGALFPLFFGTAAIRRLLARFHIRNEPDASRRSVIGEAQENMSIAVSYALMARAMLQSFARQ